MKKKSKRLVASLFLAASLLFSSCGGGVSGGGGEPTPVDPDAPVIPDPEKPEDVPEPEDIPEELPDEDTPTDVEEEGLSDEAKAAFDRLIEVWGGQLPSDAYEQLEALAIKHGVSNNVLKLFFKLLADAREAYSPSVELSMGMMDEELDIFKEIRIADLMAFMKEFGEKFFVIDTSNYLTNYDIGGVYLKDLERLEKIASTVNDAEFTSLVQTYKDEFDSLEFSEGYLEYQESHYGISFNPPEEYMAVFNLIDDKTQLGLVRMIEQLRGAIGEERVRDFFEQIIKNASSSEYLNTVIADGQDIHQTTKTKLNSSSALELFKLSDFKNAVYVLLQDRKNAELVVNVLRNIVLPAMKEIMNQNEEQRADLLKFEKSLEILKADHVIAVGNLLNNLLGLFTEEDYQNILESYSDISYLLSLLISKKQGIADVIKGIGATERGLLADVGNLFGIDVLKILDTVAENIVKITSMTDQTSGQAIANIMQVVADVQEKYQEKIGQAFDTLDGGSYSGSMPSKGYVYASIYDGEIKEGLTVAQINELVANGQIGASVHLQYDELSIYSFSEMASNNIDFTINIDSSKAGYAMYNFEFSFEYQGESVVLQSDKRPIAIKKAITGDAIATKLYSALFSPYYTTDLTEAIYSTEQTLIEVDMGEFFRGQDGKVINFTDLSLQKGWNLLHTEYTDLDGEVHDIYAPCFAFEAEHPEECSSFSVEYWAYSVVNNPFSSYVRLAKVDVDYGVYQLYFTSTTPYDFQETPSFVPTEVGTGTFEYNLDSQEVTFHYIAIDKKELGTGYITLSFDFTNAEFDEDGKFESDTYSVYASKNYYCELNIEALGLKWTYYGSISTESRDTVSNLLVSRIENNQYSYLEFDYGDYHYACYGSTYY